MHLIWLQ